MKDRRFFIGVVVSALWLAFMAYMLFSPELPSELNAWGDFFAGFFAPLAFLWLVLGYLQQGEELRHSRAALLLQAEELRKSVEQQRELVDVTRTQVRQEMQAHDEEREARIAAVRPAFVISSGGTLGDGRGLTYKLDVRNVGQDASSIKISIDPPELAGGQGFWVVDHMGPRDSRTFDLRTSDSTVIKCRLTIDFLDVYVKPGQSRYSLELHNGSLSALKET